MSARYEEWVQRASDAYSMGFTTRKEYDTYKRGKILAVSFNEHVHAVSEDPDFAKDYASPFFFAIEVFTIPDFKFEFVRLIDEFSGVPRNSEEFSLVFMKNLLIDYKDDERVQLAYFLGVHDGTANREDEPSSDSLEDIDYGDEDGAAIEANIHTHLQKINDDFTGMLSRATTASNVPVWKQRFEQFETVVDGLLLKKHSLLKIFYNYCKVVRNHGADCVLPIYGEQSRNALMDVSPAHVFFIEKLLKHQKNADHKFVISWKTTASRTSFFHDLLSYVGLALSSRKHIEKLIFDVGSDTDINFSWWFQIVVNVIAVLPNLKKISFVKKKQDRQSFFRDHSFSLYLNHLGVYMRANQEIRALSINKNITIESSSMLEEFMERVFSKTPGTPTIRTLKLAAKIDQEQTSELYAIIFGHPDVDLGSIVNLKFGKLPYHDEAVYLPVLEKTSPDTLKNLQIAFTPGERSNDFLSFLSIVKLDKFHVGLDTAAFIDGFFIQIASSLNVSLHVFTVDVLINNQDTDEKTIESVVKDFRDRSHILLWSISTPTEHYVNNDEIEQREQQPPVKAEEKPIIIVSLPPAPSPVASSSSTFNDERNSIAAKLRQNRRRPK